MKFGYCKNLTWSGSSAVGSKAISKIGKNSSYKRKRKGKGESGDTPDGPAIPPAIPFRMS